MVDAAWQDADHVVLTSDNPRHEDPNLILRDMTTALDATQQRNTLIELDRAAAIRLAIDRAMAQDVILLAGKGHEAYQEIADIKHPFCDVQTAQTYLAHLINKNNT
jgi:UDP-N-acetylmuramoyl-L-alanyl-D-glutamate--2,6-diaminopimelate ligase